MIESKVETWNHSVAKLVVAVSNLQVYPQFEKLLPKIKKEIEARFKNVKPNRKGIKKIGKVQYHPNGLVTTYINQYFGGSVHYETFVSPYEVQVKDEKQKKKSVTQELVKEKIRYLTTFYKWLCYQKLGIRINPGVRKVREERINKSLDMIKKVEQNNDLDDETKEKLITDLYQKMFSDQDWRDWEAGQIYSYKNEVNVEEKLIYHFKSLIFNTNCYDSSLCRFYNNTENQCGDYDGDEVFAKLKKMNKLFAFSFAIPTDALITCLLSDTSDTCVDYSKLPHHTIYAGTWKEFIQSLREYMYGLNNDTVTAVMKKIGFIHPEVKNDKDTRKISDKKGKS
jgi:hypothetical protein